MVIRLRAEHLFYPSDFIWGNLAGLLMNGRDDVTWPACKQTQLYGPESIIYISLEVGKVDCGELPELILKSSFSSLPMCISVSENDISAVREMSSFRFDFGDCLNRMCVVSSLQYAVWFIPPWRVRSEWACRGSSFISKDFFGPNIGSMTNASAWKDLQWIFSLVWTHHRTCRNPVTCPKVYVQMKQTLRCAAVCSLKCGSLHLP